jgi:hypothetical protein
VANADSLVVIDTSTNAALATVPRGNSGANVEVAITPPIAGPATPSPGTPPAAKPPTVKILSGPKKETANQKATFTFPRRARGHLPMLARQRRLDPRESGQTFGPLPPGDHLFQVRETLNARARVFVFAHQHRVRLVIHYKTYRPAEVTVSYRLSGAKGDLALGSTSDHFATAGVFRLPEGLSNQEMVLTRAAKSMKVRFKIPKTPSSCGRYYSKQLTIPKRIFGQTVWFQSDSLFAPP